MLSSFLSFPLIAYGLNDDVPEYDMDNDDEKWLEGFNKKKVIVLLVRSAKQIVKGKHTSLR